MNQTVVTRLMKAIEIAYKEHLPQWEFPNKEIWIQEEKEQMIDFAMEYVNSDSIGCLWDGDSAPELDIDTSAEQYYNRIFKTNEK